MNDCTNEHRVKFTFIDLFLPLFMILAQYKVGGSFSNYGFVILFLYAIYSVFFRSRALYVHKWLLLFTLYMTFISIVNLVRLENFSSVSVNRIIVPVIMMFVIFAIINKVNYRNFFKTYLAVGSVALLIMYYQAIRLLVFGVPAIPVTILPISPEDAHFWGDFLGLRPSGLFAEPQAYASFMVPLLVLAIKEKRAILGYIISFSIFLSTSSQGILLVGIVYLYFILFSDYKKIYKIIIGSFVVFFIFAMLNFSIFQFASNKIAKTEIEDNIRLTRGFVVYSTFSFPDLLLGINNTLESYILKSNKFSWVEHHIENDSEHLLGYTTTVSGIFIQFGFIAAIIFFMMIFKMYKNDDKDLRIFLFLILILSFSQTLLYNGWFVFYYVIYMGLADKFKYKNNYSICKLKIV